MLLSEAIAKYQEFLSMDVKEGTGKRYILDINQFCLFERDRDLDSVTSEEVIAFLKIRKKLGTKQNSLYKIAVTMRGFFDFCYRRGWSRVHKDSIPIPPREYNQPRVATEKEYRKILKIVDGEAGRKARASQRKSHIRNAAMIRMLWDTGVRAGELVSLNLADLKPWKHGGTATINTEKSRGQVPFRQIFWGKETDKYLKKWIAERARYAKSYNLHDPHALFISSSQGRYGKRMSPHALSICMRKYSKKAGIPTLNCHSFRHHKGRVIIEKGGSGADVMNILGHARLESSNPYVRLYGEEVKERAKKFL